MFIIMGMESTCWQATIPYKDIYDVQYRLFSLSVDIQWFVAQLAALMKIDFSSEQIGKASSY